MAGRIAPHPHQGLVAAGAARVGGMRTELLVYDGMDLMDFGGPFEVLLTADRLRQRNGAEHGARCRLGIPHSAPLA